MADHVRALDEALRQIVCYQVRSAAVTPGEACARLTLPCSPHGRRRAPRAAPPAQGPRQARLTCTDSDLERPASRCGVLRCVGAGPTPRAAAHGAPGPCTVHNDGTESFLLRFSGTVPITYGGSTYHIPVTLWIVEQYPFRPPLVFVTPTAGARAALPFNWAPRRGGHSAAAALTGAHGRHGGGGQPQTRHKGWLRLPALSE